MIKKNYIVILLILFKSSIVFSIGLIYPDSVKTDMQRIEWLFSKGKKSLFTNLDSASFFTNEAIKIQNSIENNDFFGSLYQLKGNIELYKGDNQKAIQYYEKSYHFFQNKNNLKGLTAVIYNMGIIYFNSSQFDKALEKNIEALKYAQKIPDSVLISNCYSSISFIYSEKKEYNKALEFLKKSFDIDKSLNYKLGLAYSYSNIADIYENLGILDSVVNNRQESLKLFKELKNDQGLAMCYNGLGSYYFTINKLNLALNYYELSLNLREKVGDKMGQALTLNAQARVLLRKNNLIQAEKKAKQSLQIASKIDGLNEAKNSYKILSEIVSKKNNFKDAYQYYIKYTKIKDSIFSKENMNKIAELETKYETEKKNVKIKELNIQQIRDKNIQRIFIIIIVVLIFLAGVFLMFYRQRIKINNILKNKNTQLKQLNNTQNRLMSIISHDFKAPLSAFYSITNSLKTKYDKIEKKEIDNYFNRMLNSSVALKMQLENMLNWAINQSREINVNKSNMNMHIIALKVIMILQEFAKEKSILIKNNIPQDINIYTDGKLLSIVLNNLIANSVKFSNPQSEILISAQKENNKLIISVRDFGIGMNNNEINNLFTNSNDISKNENSGTGLGLIVSKDIITKLGGKIWAKSKINKGTEFFIELYNP